MEYMILSILVAVVYLAQCNLASQVGNTFHEQRADADRASGAWRPVSRLSPDSIVPVRIALKQNNLDIGVDRLVSISHPESVEYGKTLSADEVAGLFAPSDESVQRVRSWLLESGVPSTTIMQSDNKGWLAVDMTAAHAEHLLASELYEFENAETGKPSASEEGMMHY